MTRLQRASNVLYLTRVGRASYDAPITCFVWFASNAPMRCFIWRAWNVLRLRRQQRAYEVVHMTRLWRASFEAPATRLRGASYDAPVTCFVWGASNAPTRCFIWRACDVLRLRRQQRVYEVLYMTRQSRASFDASATRLESALFGAPTNVLRQLANIRASTCRASFDAPKLTRHLERASPVLLGSIFLLIWGRWGEHFIHLDAKVFELQVYRRVNNARTIFCEYFFKVFLQILVQLLGIWRYVNKISTAVFGHNKDKEHLVQFSSQSMNEVLVGDGRLLLLCSHTEWPKIHAC